MYNTIIANQSGDVSMGLMWNKELETGNAVIDSQHKQLVDKFNVLMDACAYGHGAEEVESALKFLAEYTVRHFTDEEELQLQYGYPNYENHKKLHEQFKVTVGNLSDMLDRDGITPRLILKLNSDIGNWLRTHIMCEDLDIANFIRSKDSSNC